MEEYDLNSWEDHILDDEPVETQEDELLDEPQEEEESGDLIEHLLKEKGINPESVKIETDNGIEELNFNDLSLEEQLSILNEQQNNDTDLDQDEINLINQLRRNNWSIQDYNNYIVQQAMNSQQNNTEPVYSVDDYSDEELFVADLQSRFPDITEDEAVEELQNAKQNEDLFERKIQALRNQYKEKEDENRAQLEAETKHAQEQQMEQFKDTVLNTIEQNKEIDLGGITLEMTDDDMNTVASFILDSDQAGVRHIAKALNDPNNIFQFAWWITRGQDAFRELNNYYKQEITRVAKNNYNKGVEDARSGNINSAKAVVKKPRKSNKQQQNVEDLFDEII